MAEFKVGDLVGVKYQEMKGGMIYSDRVKYASVVAVRDYKILVEYRDKTQEWVLLTTGRVV